MEQATSTTRTSMGFQRAKSLAELRRAVGESLTFSAGTDTDEDFSAEAKRLRGIIEARARGGVATVEAPSRSTTTYTSTATPGERRKLYLQAAIERLTTGRTANLERDLYDAEKLGVNVSGVREELKYGSIGCAIAKLESLIL